MFKIIYILKLLHEKPTFPAFIKVRIEKLVSNVYQKKITFNKDGKTM